MKNVLITGACGGMGSAAANVLAAKGWRVFALDLHRREAGERIIPIAADVTDAADINKALEAVSGYTDRLDAIVHFAGLYMLDSLVEIGESDRQRIFDVNLFGVMQINKTFLPLLGAGSRILITTSELAPLDPLPFTGIYAVTKGALDKYAYSLCMELQLLNIKVSVLRAGAVNTDMLGVSTDALDRFCKNTRLYSCNAERFKRIVAGVEARCVPPQKIGEKCANILEKSNPRFAYAINRNPLLLMLNAMPKQLQLWVIKTILR